MRGSTKRSWQYSDSWKYQTTKIATYAVSKQQDFHKNSEFYICWGDICDWRNIESRNTTCTKNIRWSYAVRFMIYKADLIQNIAKLLKEVAHWATQISWTIWDCFSD